MSETDALWVVSTIVAVLVSAFMAMYVLDSLTDTFNADFASVPEAANTTTTAMDWIALTDGGIVFVFFAYIIVILLLAYLLPANIVFAVLMFVLIIVQIPVADFLQHYVNNLITTAEFTTYADSFPNTLLILDNSPLILTVTAILTAVIQFGKASQQRY